MASHSLTTEPPVSRWLLLFTSLSLSRALNLRNGPQQSAVYPEKRQWSHRPPRHQSSNGSPGGSCAARRRQRGSRVQSASSQSAGRGHPAPQGAKTRPSAAETPYWSAARRSPEPAPAVRTDPGPDVSRAGDLLPGGGSWSPVRRSRPHPAAQLLADAVCTGDEVVRTT